MPAFLTDAEVERYQRRGFLEARPLLGAEEVAAMRAELEAFEARQGAPISRLPGQVRAKTHLLFPWLADLVRHPVLLDAIESLLGPDLLVYHLTCWVKEPGDGSFVSWHQDGTYFGLDAPEHVTAWVGLNDANARSGCMRVWPGSHLRGQLEHAVGTRSGNLLSNGQCVTLTVPVDRTELLEVPAGHFSLHHTYLVHSSSPNGSDERRIGIGISYIPTRLAHTSARMTASLVRGVDRHGYHDGEARPGAAYDAAARAEHAAACRRFFSRHGSSREKRRD